MAEEQLYFPGLAQTPAVNSLPCARRR